MGEIAAFLSHLSHYHRRKGLKKAPHPAVFPETGQKLSCHENKVKKQDILTEIYQETTVSFLLVAGEGYDARQIVFLDAEFFLKSKKSHSFPLKASVPLRNSPQLGILFRRFELRHRTGKAPHRNIGFCGPKTTWPRGTNSGNKSWRHFHPPPTSKHHLSGKFPTREGADPYISP